MKYLIAYNLLAVKFSLSSYFTQNKHILAKTYKNVYTSIIMAMMHEALHDIQVVELTPLPRKASFAAIVRKNTAGQNEFLVSFNTLSQQWTFPGGGQKKEDNGDPVRTVIREVQEETGISLQRQRVSEFLTATVPGYFGGEQSAHFYIAEVTPEEAEKITSTDEMTDHRWITEEDAQKLVDAEPQQMDRFILLGIQHVNLNLSRSPRRLPSAA